MSGANPPRRYPALLHSCLDCPIVLTRYSPDSRQSCGQARPGVFRNRKSCDTSAEGCRTMQLIAPPAYNGTPDTGPVPRLFSSDFTPGKDFDAVSAAAAWPVF